MATVRYMRLFSWNSFDCTIDQRSKSTIQQGLRRMFSDVQVDNTAESFC